MANKLITKRIGVPINKGYEEKESSIIVRGFFTSDVVDEVGDVITREATVNAVPKYRQWGNIRYMHQPRPVAKVVNIGEDDGLAWNEVEIEVVDPEAIFQVKNGLLKALSVGIIIRNFEDIDIDSNSGQWVIHNYDLAEISLVDHPANYDARLFLDEEKSVPVNNDVRSLVSSYGFQEVAKALAVGGNVHKSLEELDMLKNKENQEAEIAQEEILEEEVVEEKAVDEVVEEKSAEESVEEEASEEPVEEVEEPEEEQVEEEVVEEKSEEADNNVDESIEVHEVSLSAESIKALAEALSDSFVKAFSKALESQAKDISEEEVQLVEDVAEETVEVEEEVVEQKSDDAEVIKSLLAENEELRRTNEELKSQPAGRQGKVYSDDEDEVEEKDNGGENMLKKALNSYLAGDPVITVRPR